MIIRIGTRGSALALWQANYVLQQLEKNGLMAEIVIIHTQGDKIQEVALSKIGSKGLFTQELEQALRNQEIDIAVHSAKDVPADVPADLPIVAFSVRENPADVLISHKTVSLEKDTLVIGTSSTRRIAFLNHYYPQHTVKDVRGNVQTRIRKLEEGQYDALVMAYAGIHRLMYQNYIQQVLPIDTFVPPAGQGALAIQMHVQHPQKAMFKAILNDEDTAVCIQMERSFLHAVGGGCSIPIFAYSRIQDNTVSLHAGLISPKGEKIAQSNRHCARHETELLIQQTVSEVLEKQGGKEILACL
jgi:hydroxymethylbilane synthase